MPSDHYQMLDEKSVFLSGCDSNQFVYQSMKIYIGDEYGYLSTGREQVVS